MTWFKADDQLPFHPKVLAAGNAAMGLWIRAGTWSSSQLTDGFIPKAIANAMANECDADALVASGLWDRVNDSGYQFHDWEDFQPSAEKEREKRAARKRAGQAGAKARWGDSSGAPRDGKSHGKSHGTSHSKPDGKADGKTMPRSRPLKTPTESLGQSFDAWWSIWPKKTRKQQARDAYRAAVKELTPEQLLTLTSRWVKDFEATGKERQFMPDPDRWLKHKRWEDDLTTITTTGPRQVDPLWKDSMQ